MSRDHTRLLRQVNAELAFHRWWAAQEPDEADDWYRRLGDSGDHLVFCAKCGDTTDYCGCPEIDQ